MSAELNSFCRLLILLLSETRWQRQGQAALSSIDAKRMTLTLWKKLWASKCWDLATKARAAANYKIDIDIVRKNGNVEHLWKSRNVDCLVLRLQWCFAIRTVLTPIHRFPERWKHLKLRHRWLVFMKSWENSVCTYNEWNQDMLGNVSRHLWNPHITRHALFA